MVKHLKYGLWYPDADDCFACVSGNPHNQECVGVLMGSERIYNSGMEPWGSSNRSAVERAVRS